MKRSCSWLVPSSRIAISKVNFATSSNFHRRKAGRRVKAGRNSRACARYGFKTIRESWQSARNIVVAHKRLTTTFLPCFIFIFLGALYIEVLRRNKNLTGALSGVTASVVGVVLNLALVFGAAVIWQQGLGGGFDLFAAVLSVAAFVALYKLKADVLWVVLAGGLIGLGRTLLLR